MKTANDIKAMEFKDATNEEIDQVMNAAWHAFHGYRKLSLKKRADFMRSIARELEASGDELLEIASQETNLPESRLRNERARTIFQLNSYADACESGEWIEARIDTANAERNPPKPDLRKMLHPLGPVVVFGASNFPFAYSTAGGDTACAFAAGCPVIVKAHPAHARTSELVANAIKKAAGDNYLPAGVFAHVHGSSNAVGKFLVTHKHTCAVGFTGSFMGGKALFDWANHRDTPIPVFAEMGSVNPVFLLPDKMQADAGGVAKMYASSITLGAGQFCTNPGLIFGIDNEHLKTFIQSLADEIRCVEPATMLHTGIFKSYVEKRALALSHNEVETIAVAEKSAQANQGVPTIASATAEAYLKNPLLHQEVFGPYSLVVRCRDLDEMVRVAQETEGQLTATLMATEEDLRTNDKLVEAVKNICGRLIMNGVPTGVEVCQGMHHGGPFPATTDSRFTSVGADGIKRFARPIAYQGWPDGLLPDELKDANPLGIWRMVNNEMTKGEITV